jgi:hypothetical protein
MPRRRRHGRSGRSGNSRCCGFPTFSWKRTIPAAIAERIALDFPTWSPGRGACERCVEGYAVPAGMGGTP